MTSSQFRFVISATFTAEPVASAIEFWAGPLKVNFEVSFTAFNQVIQSLADPQSQFQQNRHGTNAILLRADDLGSHKRPANTQLLIDHLKAYKGSVPLLIFLCPSRLGYDPDFKSLFATAEIPSGVHILDERDVAQNYPVLDIHLPDDERFGGIPYTDPYFCALGTTIVRYSQSLIRAPRKVIAIDCDNTLWLGVCGEDGPDAVLLDPARRFLHEFLLEQHSRGVLLVLASKNNEQDVIDTFAVHPEFPLQLEHFVDRRLSWQSKAKSLEESAQHLGLALNSYLFLDDSPKEIEEMLNLAPMVLSLGLPKDGSRLPEFLRHVWAFDRPVVTEEDRKRNSFYQQSTQFAAESRQSPSLRDFIATLHLRVSIAPFSSQSLPRVAQLTQRTNQFNFTGVRRTEAEVSALLLDKQYRCHTVEASDRFGEYGLVGVLITKLADTQLVVDTFLLSCRALGRGVEHQMLAFLGHQAGLLEADSVVLHYVQMPRNAPARQFLLSLKIGELTHRESAVTLAIPAGGASGVEWSPDESPSETTPPKGEPRVEVSLDIDYAYIANNLSTVDLILKQSRNGVQADIPEHWTNTETALAQIWAELLGRPSIARTDNFFDIGGHSLLAVLLLIRIREAFGVELSIEDVYSGELTLAGLSTRVETSQLGDIDPQEYAALLAEIEAMSDEEAKDLLEREQTERR